METLIREILIEASRAPSGDNMQPWRFTLEENVLHIFNIPGSDPSLYNWNEYGSLIAIGALVENITTLAPFFGLSCLVSIFPHTEKDAPVSTITFTHSKTPPPDTRLRGAVARRATNRKPYENTPFSEVQMGTLTSIFSDESGFTLQLFDRHEDRKSLGKFAAANESVLFGNKTLHNFFFTHIHWQDTKAEGGVPTTTRGFLEESLEIPKQGKPIFRLMRSWRMTSFFNTVGLTKLIVSDNAKLYATGAAMGVITYSKKGNPTLGDYVQLGILLERAWVWLMAEGFWLHPLVGIPALARRRGEGGGGLDVREEAIVTRASDGIAHIAGVSRERIVALFRTGKAEAPTRMTERDTPDIELVRP